MNSPAEEAAAQREPPREARLLPRRLAVALLAALGAALALYAPAEPVPAAWAFRLGLVAAGTFLLYALLQDLWRARLRPLYDLLPPGMPPPSRPAELAAALKTRLAELEDGEQRYRRLLILSSDWYWERDAEGRLSYVSQGFQRATGTDPAPYLGSTRESESSLHIAPDVWRQLEHRLASREAFRDVEWQLDLPDGRVLHALSSGEPVFDRDGQFQGYRGVSRDISELKRAEQALTRLNQELEARVEQRTEQLAQASREAEAANRAKSRFLANMSHEIRTPLNAVLGYAQLLRADPGLPAELLKLVTPIEKSSMHLLRLINDILDLSKIEAGAIALKRTDFELGELLDELLVMFALRCQQKGLSQRLERDFPVPCAVSGDAGKLRQVLFNLLGNAVKFTASGTITLSARRLAGERYRFEVSDQGPGIAVADQAAIFQPFQQAGPGEQAGGTGLGLSIARRLVECMGGTLELRSAPDQGSCFHFELELPAATGRAVEAPAPEAAAGPAHRPRVLVADDTGNNRRVLGHMLAHLGVDIVEARDGREALERLREQPVDLVFMDLYMPQMDGLHALQRLRTELPGGGPPCVAVTASAFEQERERCLSQGFDDFIAKPLLVDELRRCLRRHLGARYAEPADERTEARPLAIPGELRQRLLDAVACSWLSGIKAGILELERLGPEAAATGERLRELLHHYDLDGLRRELEGLHDAS